MKGSTQPLDAEWAMREQFTSGLIVAREKNGITTLKLDLPSILIYIFNNKGEMTGGFSAEPVTSACFPAFYLGNAWADDAMNLLTRGREWFASRAGKGTTYIIHSTAQTIPMWRRAGFKQTGAQLTHPEVEYEGKALETFEMVKR